MNPIRAKVVRSRECGRWHYICGGCGHVSTPTRRWRMALFDARMHVGHERFRARLGGYRTDPSPWVKAR